MGDPVGEIARRGGLYRGYFASFVLTHPPEVATPPIDRGGCGGLGEAVFPGLSPAEQALMTRPAQERALVDRAGAGGPGLQPGAQARPPPGDPRAQPDLARDCSISWRSSGSARWRDNGEPGAAGTAVVPVTAGPLSPDRTQHHRDVRKDLQEKVASPRRLSELVNEILERACDCQATDIHFDPQENGLRVRYRIDGQLQDILFIEPAMATPVISRLKIVSNLNIVERRHSQDGRITIQHHNRPRDLRLATFPTIVRREDRHPDPRGPDRRHRVHPSGHDTPSRPRRSTG